jgi:hypothetical protein
MNNEQEFGVVKSSSSSSSKSTYKDDILYDGSVPVSPNLPCQKSALRKKQSEIRMFLVPYLYL